MVESDHTHHTKISEWLLTDNAGDIINIQMYMSAGK